ncbi:MAG: S-layer homology domain-containing protein, partial [Tumebacillaceae bacterium]
NAAGALYIENGTVHSVPATFVKNADGTTTVTINRPGFSTYAVATHNVAFTDISSSFAKAKIESLANKFLVYGTSDSTFSPKQNVTRAQFAALLVRALGLQGSATAAPFKDVKSSDWFAADVATAYQAGLISGVGNGEFAPAANVSRQDLTVMLSKAMNLLKIQASGSAHTYADASSFKSYAKDSINTVSQAGLMTGEDKDGTFYFHPSDATTREAAATVLYNLLQKGNLIN